ncbi:MAG TPA: hypothetical protein VFF33_13165 [Ignavibacteriaceae bacterium]|nr:hypothetical protein [Ignavibacteriaceae bacterium]
MIKIFLASLLLFINICAQDYKQLLKEGDEFTEKFQVLNALNKYQEAYKVNPNDFDVLFKLTRTYNSAGEEAKELKKDSDAEKYFNKAVETAEIFYKKYPDRAEANIYMAASYGNLGLFKGSKEKIKISNKVKQFTEKAMKINPNYYLPYTVLGKYNYEIAKLSWFEKTFANTFLGKVPEGSFEESERLLKKAIQIEPDLIISYYYLSLTYQEMDKEKEEKALINKILKMPDKEFRDKYIKKKVKERLDDM